MSTTASPDRSLSHWLRPSSAKFRQDASEGVWLHRRVAPLSADVPAVGAASPGATITVTALTASAPEPAQLSATATQPGQTARMDATAETFGVPHESLPEPMKTQGGKHSEPIRAEKTSTEIVYGTVTKVPDAMTWIVKHGEGSADRKGRWRLWNRNWGCEKTVSAARDNLHALVSYRRRHLCDNSGGRRGFGR